MKGLRTTSTQFKNLLEVLNSKNYSDVALGVTLWFQMGPHNKLRVLNKLINDRTSYWISDAKWNNSRSCRMQRVFSEEKKHIIIYIQHTSDRVKYMTSNIEHDIVPF